MFAYKEFAKLTLGCGHFVNTKPSACSYASLKSINPSYFHPNPINRPRPTKHAFKAKTANPKFRKERASKVTKVDLPDFHEKGPDDMTPSEIRKKMKERGIQPHRPWNERVIYLASTGATFEPFVPPEGDGKAAFLSEEGAKQKFAKLTGKGRSMMAVRKIRQFDEEFSNRAFLEEAKQIYDDLHKAIGKQDKDLIHKLATETVFNNVIHESKYKTIRWSFIGTLEKPRIVHIRQTKLVEADNLFAQITVRFHTQQTLAVYDRFGRLQHGSEVVARDVLEYVVYEKNISNTYGLWRLHDKIVPDWMKSRPTAFRTHREPPPAKEETKEVTVTISDPNEESKEVAAIT